MVEDYLNYNILEKYTVFLIITCQLNYISRSSGIIYYTDIMLDQNNTFKNSFNYIDLGTRNIPHLFYIFTFMQIKLREGTLVHVDIKIPTGSLAVYVSDIFAVVLLLYIPCFSTKKRKKLINLIVIVVQLRSLNCVQWQWVHISI